VTRHRPPNAPAASPRLGLEQAFATVELPITLDWSQPGRPFNLADRTDRARVYEIVLREGTPTDVRTYIDGALLIDVWHELVLPQDVRTEWLPLLRPFVQM